MSRRQLVLANRDRIREIAAECNVVGVALFGSTARGTDTAESDCDFVAECTDTTSLLDLSRMMVRLEDLLGCDIDVVPHRTIPVESTTVSADKIDL